MMAEGEQGRDTSSGRWDHDRHQRIPIRTQDSFGSYGRFGQPPGETIAPFQPRGSRETGLSCVEAEGMAVRGAESPSLKEQVPRKEPAT
jgi:hypothetical protein